MNLIPGAVTPLGLLNDKEKKVQFFIDKDFMSNQHLVGVHPNDNTASIWMRADDLVSIIREHGNPVTITEMKED